jgi:hypothetical protein
MKVQNVTTFFGGGIDEPSEDCQVRGFRYGKNQEWQLLGELGQY